MIVFNICHSCTILVAFNTHKQSHTPKKATSYQISIRSLFLIYRLQLTLPFLLIDELNQLKQQRRQMAKIWFERPSEEVISRRGVMKAVRQVLHSATHRSRSQSKNWRECPASLADKRHWPFQNFIIYTRTQAEWNVNEIVFTIWSWRVAQSAQSIAQQFPVICLSLWILYWRKL